jgi:hypothetical protein
MITGAPVTPQDFGAVGDGTTNDTAALTAMFATNKPWYIPYTSGGYLVNNTLAPKASGVCAGFLLADTGYANLVINITGLGYQPNVKITGLNIQCKSARTSSSVGIRVNSPSVVLDRCKVQAFDYGIQVWTYSVMLLNCNAHMCKTNLSAYAPSPASEINDLKVIGGNYDSATEYSCRIGDPRFTTTVPAAELMGTPVLFLGVAFDAATSTFDRIYGLTIKSCYWENATQGGKAIILGGSGNGWMRNVSIEDCYFSTLTYAIYCDSPIRGLKIGKNYYGGGMVNALYTVNNELYGFSYEAGVTTSGFSGPEVHTGFGAGIAVGQLIFGGITITNDFVDDGVQVSPAIASTSNWYPNGSTQDGNTHVTSSVGRFKTNPASAVPGVFSGTSFTCGVISASYSFNGGDRITSSTGGFIFVCSVDYTTGVLILSGGTATGGGSISQSTAIFRNINVYGSAAPVAGTWRAGDLVYNSAPTSAGYVGWVCTVAGTPGTWKTFGLIT